MGEPPLPRPADGTPEDAPEIPDDARRLARELADLAERVKETPELGGEHGKHAQDVADRAAFLAAALARDVEGR